MRSDQSSLSFRVGHYHVQLTAVDMHNFTIDGKKDLSLFNGMHHPIPDPHTKPNDLAQNCESFGLQSGCLVRKWNRTFRLQYHKIPIITPPPKKKKINK